MAVLNKIRQRSVFLIIIIALALFSFVLADVIQNGGFSSQKSQTTIATVNGVDIPREDFARLVDNARQNLGANAGATQAMQMAWNSELRSILLQQQYEELGVRAEASQIEAAMEKTFASNPQFQNEAGMLDYQLVRQYINNIRANAPQQYEQWVENIKQQMYLNMVRAGVGATVVEGELDYRMQSDNVNIKYVQIPYASISDDSVEVTETEIADYIKKNKKEFEVEATVDIQYVLFKEEPSAADDAQVKEELEALLSKRVEYNSASQTNDTLPAFKDVTDYANFVAQYSEGEYLDYWQFKSQLPDDNNRDRIFSLEVGETYGPYKEGNQYRVTKITDEAQLHDSIKVSHILVTWQDLQTAAGVTRNKEEARQLADSLYNIVRRDGEKFGELALGFSNDPSVAQNSGDLGYLSPGSTVKPFDDFMIENAEGSTGVVETQFGYHVISVQEKKNKQRAVKLATVTRTVYPSEETTSNLFDQATQFERQAGEGDFVDVANSLSLEVRPVNKIEELQENIPGVGANRLMVTWAFGEDTKVGDMKRFSVGGDYAIVQLTAKNKKGLMSVAEASATVTPILRNQKKAKQIIENNKGASLEDIASNKSTPIKSASALNMQNPTIADAGTEPKVVGTAFGLKAGETSDFIEGKKGVYKITVTAINKADDLDSYQGYVERLSNTAKTGVNAGLFNALKEKAEIEDRRANFY